MIDLDENHLDFIRSILVMYVPSCEIRIFGSRIQGTGEKFSDLDIAIVGKSVLPSGIIRNIKETFSSSDLPIMVDVLDWHKISPEFQAVINKHYEIFDISEAKS